MIYQTGSHYVGNWANGEWSGEGTYESTDFRVRDKNWGNGKQMGAGTIIVKNPGTKGNPSLMVKYIGAWRRLYVNDVCKQCMFCGYRIQGKGTATYRDGQVYVGNWLGGTRSGHGKITFNVKFLLKLRW